MATKIEKILSVSGKDLYAQRGKVAAQSLTNAINMKALKVQQEITNLEMKEARMMDLGKTDENSLVPNSPENCDALIDSLIALDIERQNLEIEQKAIERVKKEYFTDEETVRAEG